MHSPERISCRVDLDDLFEGSTAPFQDKKDPETVSRSGF